MLMALSGPSRPPVLLAHGTGDTRVPFPSMTDAGTAPRADGVPVETLVCVGTGHSIDQQRLARGGLFPRQVLDTPPHREARVL